MAVSPADFYAYSRATGVAIPDEPEERARMAPEVLEFRRNQLKAATPTGPDPLSVGLGIGLALAGGGAGVLAAQQALNKQKLSAVGGTRADLTRVKDFDLSRVPSVQQQAPTTETVVADLSQAKRYLPALTRKALVHWHLKMIRSCNLVNVQNKLHVKLLLRI